MPLSLIIGEREAYTRAGKLRRIQDTVIPEQLFRITYPDNIKFFVLEAYRASEDYETSARSFAAGLMSWGTRSIERNGALPRSWSSSSPHPNIG